MSFKMVDKICEVSYSSIKTIKLLSIAEPVYEIHFPFFPVLPAVLLLENVKQSIDIFIRNNEEEKICFFQGVKKLKVYKALYPGDGIFTEVFLISKTEDCYVFDATIYHNETIAAKLKEVKVVVEKEKTAWEKELQSQV